MQPTRREPNSKNEDSKISPGKEQEDLENAIQASSGFANPYGEEDYEEAGAIEKLSPDDDEFDFGVEDTDDEADIEEIKKSFRH